MVWQIQAHLSLNKQLSGAKVYFFLPFFFLDLLLEAAPFTAAAVGSDTSGDTPPAQQATAALNEHLRPGADV